MASFETTLDLTQILRDAPPGDWVALSQDHCRIVSTAETMEEAVRLAQDAGEANPIVFKVPPVSALIV
jgi:hypothetical protein